MSQLHRALEGHWKGVQRCCSKAPQTSAAKEPCASNESGVMVHAEPPPECVMQVSTHETNDCSCCAGLKPKWKSVLCFVLRDTNSLSKYFQNPFSSHYAGFERGRVAIGPNPITSVFFCCLRPWPRVQQPRHSIV